jgi:hypothetical protein
MYELIPILMGCCLGSASVFAVHRWWRGLASATGILVIAFGATVVSGEYNVSGAYLLVDLIEAASGFAGGVVAVKAILRSTRVSLATKAGM